MAPAAGTSRFRTGITWITPTTVTGTLPTAITTTNTDHLDVRRAFRAGWC
jgi:hypothetical protein